MTGRVFKRCSCPPVLDNAGRRKNCQKRHGSWFFIHDVRDSSGKRRPVQPGGFATAADAEAALQASLTATGMGVRVQEQLRLTVAAGARVTAPAGHTQAAAVRVVGAAHPRNPALSAERRRASADDPVQPGVAGRAETHPAAEGAAVGAGGTRRLPGPRRRPPTGRPVRGAGDDRHATARSSASAGVTSIWTEGPSGCVSPWSRSAVRASWGSRRRRAAKTVGWTATRRPWGR